MNKQKLELWKNAYTMHCKEDGSISINDLESLIRSLGYNPTPDEIEEMKNDLKREKKIEFDQFAYILYRHSRYSKPEEELERSFAIFDSDNSGFLTYSITRNILQSMKHPFNEDQIDKIIEKAGNNDGKIEIKSLVRVLLNL
ncbi:Calmodulin-like protein 4 [Tritrichomonas musculus]|uniref:Calmodulin-like protein 4 n=1 Tax=Tritrichomonas musculus TaxID=1915356 RepID=A0ABR2KSH0_9EUKA